MNHSLHRWVAIIMAVILYRDAYIVNSIADESSDARLSAMWHGVLNVCLKI